MPMLPAMELKALMRAEAEPVSPDCWDKSKKRLGGATKLPIIVVGSKVRAKAQGLIWPMVQMSTPATTVTAKLRFTKEKREKWADSLT